MTDTLHIQHGIAPDQLPQVAEIFYAAFQQKLIPVRGLPHDEAIDFIQSAIQPNNALIAVRGQQVLGLAGLNYDDHRFFTFTFGDMVRRFGLWSGIWRTLGGMILDHEPQSDVLYLEMIATHPDARGQGVGTALLDALYAFADAHHYSTIHLDVIDSNPRARQLYERQGFSVINTQRLPYMKPLGFTGVYTMARHSD